MIAQATARKMMQTFREVKAKRSILSRIREFKNHVSLLIEHDDFMVKTVESPSELTRVLQLRHEIFIEEWQGRKAFHEMDVDDYDFSADHLVILQKSTQEMIGTYRLLCSNFTDEFYSSSEFYLRDFLQHPFTQLELGRACIKMSHRNGNTIDLLWKGLAQYATMVKARYLFGCSSIKSVSPKILSDLYYDLGREGHLSNEYDISPTEKYLMPGFNLNLGQSMTPQDKKSFMPPLLRSYLNAGAKVYGEPALDRDFGCCDLLTILDLSQLSGRYKARYF